MKILRQMDLATVAGVVVVVLGLFFGFRQEGIQLSDLGQLTAALVVFCGTAGAVLISMPWKQTRHALEMLPRMFQSVGEQDSEVIQRVVELARAARQGGLLPLEKGRSPRRSIFSYRHAAGGGRCRR